MRLYELVEARVEPDKNFMSQVEQIIDDSIEEYQQVLDSNGDVDDIDELEEILNQNNYDNLPIEFIATDQEREDPNEWISAEAGLDKDGKFLAMRASSIANLGAYIGGATPNPAINNLGTIAGVYTTPAIHIAVTGVLSNTNTMTPYRGAGRPEAAYIIERMIDLAANEMDMDPIEIRRINTIPPEAMPFKTGLTFTYDSGEFEKNLNLALEMSDYTNFELRRKQAKEAGKLRGIGISNTIERAAAPPPRPSDARN